MGRIFLICLHYYTPSISFSVREIGTGTKQCDLAFQEAKEQLLSSDVLVHYDSTLPIVLAGDASAYGVGAAVSHTMPDGKERPIAFASRTLSSSEHNYSSANRERSVISYL